MTVNEEESSLSRLSALTPAEQAVLDEALTGAPAREIAERLTLSEATVRSHLSRIYVKLGVSGRLALLAAFREADPSASGGTAQVGASKRGESPRPMVVEVLGWAWASIAVLLIASAVWELSWILAAGWGGQATWMRLFSLVGAATLTALVGRRLTKYGERADLLRSVALAAFYVVASLAGIIGDEDEQVFLVGAAVAIALGWLSVRGWMSMPDSLRA